MRRYDLERGDDRNDRAVFAALIGSLIAVVAVSAIFLRQADLVPSWAYAAVPAAPLAIVALIAYIAQTAFVRGEYVRELEAALAYAAEGSSPRSLVRGHLLGWWSRVMWDFALALTVVVVVGVSALALARTESIWIEAVSGMLYGGILCTEVAAFVRVRLRASTILQKAQQHHFRSDRLAASTGWWPSVTTTRAPRTLS